MPSAEEDAALLKRVDKWPLAWRQRWADKTLELYQRQRRHQSVTLEDAEVQAARVIEAERKIRGVC